VPDHQVDDVLRHAPPPQSVSPDGPTVKEVCNRSLAYQVPKLESQEITARSFEDYQPAVIANTTPAAVILDGKPIRTFGIA
jgi:hypothetical protein